MNSKVRIRKDVSFYVWMTVAAVMMAILIIIRMRTQSGITLWLIMGVPIVYLLGHWLGGIYFANHYPNDNSK